MMYGMNANNATGGNPFNFDPQAFGLTGKAAQVAGALPAVAGLLKQLLGTKADDVLNMGASRDGTSAKLLSGIPDILSKSLEVQKNQEKLLKDILETMRGRNAAISKLPTPPAHEQPVRTAPVSMEKTTY